MVEPKNLLPELEEFMKESIGMNEVTLSVENEGLLKTTEIYADEVKFQCGLHLNRDRNFKELIDPAQLLRATAKEQTIGKIVERVPIP